MVADAAPALWAALASGAIGGSPSDVLRAGAIATALLAPGLVWVRAIFGRRAIPPADHAAFALALSLMGYALGAFALNWTPWGLQRTTWAIWFVIVVGSGLLVALRRGAGPGTVRRPRPVGLGAVVEVAVVMALVGSAYVVARVGAVMQPRPGFTQAWVVPEGSAASQVRIGLSSAEAVPTVYRIEATVDGAHVDRFDDVLLAPSETWTVQLDLSDGPTSGVLEMRVYRRSETVAYRRVTHVLSSDTVPTPDPSERTSGRTSTR